MPRACGNQGGEPEPGGEKQVRWEEVRMEGMDRGLMEETVKEFEGRSGSCSGVEAESVALK